jgi:hypothetical protein
MSFTVTAVLDSSVGMPPLTCKLESFHSVEQGQSRKPVGGNTRSYEVALRDLSTSSSDAEANLVDNRESFN